MMCTDPQVDLRSDCCGDCAPKRYNIIRNYFDKPSKLVDGGLTLEQAQAHCQREDTHKQGEWFDGYEEA